MPKPLKRAIIKEEYVALTGNVASAVILAQFEYWARRTRDFDRFIQEERQRAETEGLKVGIEETHGWVYKTADELADETMLGLHRTTIRKHLAHLVEHGWIEERENPRYKWDRTKQYRFNIAKVASDLEAIGYHLDGWSTHCATNDTPWRENQHLNVAQADIQTSQNARAIPEIITEITTENSIKTPTCPNQHSPFKECKKESAPKREVRPTPEEQAVIDVLESVEGFPKDTERTLDLVRALAEDFPTLNLLEEAKNWWTWRLDKPIKKKKANPRLAFRNWCRISAEGKYRRPQAPPLDTHEYPKYEDLAERLRRLRAECQDG